MTLTEALFATTYYIIIFVALIELYKLVSIRPCRSEKCLVGKAAIVTGGNRGIGFQISLGLATRGCRVIIACRSNADKAKEEIIRRTNNTNIVTRHLDLGSLASVRRFCKEIHETEEKIDILINNAGIGGDYNKFTKDGLHPTMQINLFGPFLLTHLLIDLLKKSGGGRIIFISSLTAFIHNFTLENMNLREGELLPFWESLQIYANTKVGLIMISNEFAERLKGHGITCNSVHPGAIRTQIFDIIERLNLVSMFLLPLMWLTRQIFFRPPVDGAQRCLNMAVSSSFENVTGTFYWILGATPAITKDREFCRKVWRQIEGYVKLSDEEKLPLPTTIS